MAKKKPAAKSNAIVGVDEGKKQHSRVSFKRSGSGVIAHGVVHELRAHSDGKSMNVTLRHGRAKQDGMFSSYEDETRLRLPNSVAKQFHMGRKVKVHVEPK